MAARRRGRGGTARRAAHRGRQRRRRVHGRSDRARRRRRLAHADGRQRHRLVPDDQARRAAHRPQRRWLDRRDLVDRRLAHPPPARRLLGQQGGDRHAGAQRRRRARRVRRARQRGPARSRADRRVAIRWTAIRPTRDDYLAQMPLGRTGTVDEIAAAVRFLAGDEAAWITGQSFGVDGGHSLRRGPDLDPLIGTMFRADDASTSDDDGDDEPMTDEASSELTSGSRWIAPGAAPAGHPTRDDIRLLSPDFYVEPEERFAWMRANAPVYWDDATGIWGLASHEAVRIAAKEWQTFCSGQGSRPDSSVPSMINMDAPRALVPSRHRQGRVHRATGRGPRAVPAPEGRRADRRRRRARRVRHRRRHRHAAADVHDRAR